MLDLVLLFAFADSPETCLPRSFARPLLRRHFEHRGGVEGLTPDQFLAWYDDELLWRVLVYGGMLLRKREKRLSCWQTVCEAMVDDLPGWA